MNNLTIFKVYHATHEHQRLVDELAVSPITEEARNTLCSSETRRNELLGALATLEFDDKTLEAALGEQIKILTERKARLAQRRDNVRASLKAIMEYGQLNKIETPTCTLSISKGHTKIKIDDEKALYREAVEYFTHVPKLDKKRLMENLKAGEVLQSAKLIGEPILVIRRK